MPHIKVGKPKAKRKKSFEISVALAMVEATYHLPPSPLLTAWRLGELMRAAIYGLYYARERTSTIFLLRWSWIEARGDGPWLEIPGEAVRKTEKESEVFLHADAQHGFERVRTSDDLIIGWPHSYDYFCDVHERLQMIAGVARNKILSPQAWRRTHATQMALVGADDGMEAARRSLNHAHVETTEEHYTSIDANMIRRLPSIRVDHDGQRRLF